MCNGNFVQLALMVLTFVCCAAMFVAQIIMAGEWHAWMCLVLLMVLLLAVGVRITWKEWRDKR